MAQDDSVRRALEGALSQSQIKVTGPLTIRTEVSGVEITIHIKGPKQPTQCEQDLLALLQRSRIPLTTSSILDALAKAGLIHGETTIKRALARLVKAGTINSSRKAPQGYTLPAVREAI